jgi:hypothetical protein
MPRRSSECRNPELKGLIDKLLVSSETALRLRRRKTSVSKETFVSYDLLSRADGCQGGLHVRNKRPEQVVIASAYESFFKPTEFSNGLSLDPPGKDRDEGLY